MLQAAQRPQGRLIGQFGCHCIGCRGSVSRCQRILQRGLAHVKLPELLKREQSRNVTVRELQAVVEWQRQFCQAARQSRQRLWDADKPARLELELDQSPQPQKTVLRQSRMPGVSRTRDASLAASEKLSRSKRSLASSGALPGPVPLTILTCRRSGRCNRMGFSSTCIREQGTSNHCSCRT